MLLALSAVLGLAAWGVSGLSRDDSIAWGVAMVVAFFGALWLLIELKGRREPTYDFAEPDGAMGYVMLRRNNVLLGGGSVFDGAPLTVPQVEGIEALYGGMINVVDATSIEGHLMDLGFAEWSEGERWSPIVGAWMGMLARGEVELLEGTSTQWELTKFPPTPHNFLTGAAAPTALLGVLSRWSWESLGLRLGPHDGATPRAMELTRCLPRHASASPYDAHYRAAASGRCAYDLHAVYERDNHARSSGTLPHGPEGSTPLPEPLSDARVVELMRAFWKASDEPLRRALHAVFRASSRLRPRATVPVTKDPAHPLQSPR